MTFNLCDIKIIRQFIKAYKGYSFAGVQITQSGGLIKDLKGEP